MHITKKQTTVIVLLNIVIAALIATIFLVRPSSAHTEDGSDEPPRHTVLREASAGAVRAIERETRLMGSGDERAVYAIGYGGVSYVFGNAAVGDLDFPAAGGFLCRLDEKGKILGYTYMDGTVKAASVVEGGFCAAVTGAESELVFFTADGARTGGVPLDGDGVKIMPISSRLVTVITSPDSKSLKLTEFNRTSDGWEQGSATRISGGLDLTVFDCYYAGGKYTLAARARDDSYDSLVFYTLHAGGDGEPHYYGGKDEGKLTPYAVTPFSGGYAAVCGKGGEGVIVTVDYSFTSFRQDSTGKNGVVGGNIAYGGGKYYFSFVGDSTTVYEATDRLEKTELATGGAVNSAVSSDGENVLVCQADGAIIISDGKRDIVKLDVKDYQIARVSKCGYRQLQMVLSARGGSALSAPTGGKNADVYIIVVKF